MEQKQDQNTKRTKVLWKKLQNFLIKDKKYTTKRMNEFSQLFNLEIVGECIKYSWISQQNIPQDQQVCKSVKIINQKDEISITEINNYNKNKVDSTGIVLWPAEEIIAYFLLKNGEKYGIQNISTMIELGSGYSGLTALILKQEYKNIKDILITDGNQECIRGLEKNIQLNSDINLDQTIIPQQLVWDINYQSEKKFDLITIADCLFFKDFHDALIQTIYQLMHKQSLTVIVAPKRGDSLQIFLDKVKDRQLFQIEIIEFNDDKFRQCYEQAKKLQDYDENQQKFYFIWLKLQ